MNKSLEVATDVVNGFREIGAAGMAAIGKSPRLLLALAPLIGCESRTIQLPESSDTVDTSNDTGGDSDTGPSVLMHTVEPVKLNADYGEVGIEIEGGTYAGTSGSPASICALLGYDPALTGDAVGYWWPVDGGPGFCPKDLNEDLTCSGYPADPYSAENSYGAPWSSSGYPIASTTTLDMWVDPEGTTWDSGFNPGWVLAVECGRYE